MSTTIYTNSNPHVQTDFDMGCWAMPDDFYDDIDTHIYEPWTHAMYGVKHTEESKQAMSESSKGIYPSEETKRKMSLAQQNREPPSDETKEKIRQSKLGENNPMYGVSLAGKKNGMYGKPSPTRRKVSVNGIIYNSCREASKAVGKSEGTFNYWLKRGKAYYV